MGGIDQNTAGMNRAKWTMAASGDAAIFMRLLGSCGLALLLLDL